MTKAIKSKAKGIRTTSVRVINNVEQFIQSSSLLVVAGFSYWALTKLELNKPVEVLVTGALVVIGLRGAYEFFKFLDK